MAARKGNSGFVDRRKLTPFQRFRSFCRFEPETGCVVWTGGTSKGRGKHIPYPVFWFEGKRWWGHRWAARYIHALDIDTFHVDHCCPNIPKPNTLCVQHLQAVTRRENTILQHERRKHFIHLQVGLIQYREVYGYDPEPHMLGEGDIPFFEPPEWFSSTEGPTHGTSDCTF